MPATRVDIERWLDTLYADDTYTHMIIKCDEFETSGQCCYPVYVTTGEDVHARAASGGDRLMEVYSRSYSRESQMAEHRARHYD